MENPKFTPDRILYEDSDLIVVNKVAGELVVSDRWKLEKRILLHAVGEYLREQGHQLDASGRDLYAVHRLDRDTSGAVVFAKHRESHRTLSRAFEERGVEKLYWLLTCGCPPWRQRQVDLPLSRREGKRGKGRGYVDLKHGKPAQTEFNVLRCFGDIAWLEAKPLTGRLHQIRLHAQAEGFPLLNDPHYAQADWRSQYHALALQDFKRIPLHARRLSFAHPSTQATVEIVAPLVDDIGPFMRGLAKRSRESVEF